MRYISLLALLVLSCSGDKKSTNSGSQGTTATIIPPHAWNCNEVSADDICIQAGYDHAETYSCTTSTEYGEIVKNVICWKP